jgi:predicted membrane metal-binding protein
MNHEAFGRDDTPQPPSERSFAVVFTVFFSLVALWPLVRGRAWRPWALAVAAVFLAAGLVRPSVLRRPNLWWFRLALLLNRIVNPVVIGILFFGVVTPFAVVMRWAGKDPLRLRRDSTAPTYWIERDPPGPEPKSMVAQF